MMRSLVVTGTATTELSLQAEYIAHSSLDRALRFYEAAGDSFQRLLVTPDLGVACEIDQPALAGVRVWPIRGYPNHLIYYRATDSEIEILRILHGARDVGMAFQ